jgi:hypothetical protein
MNDWLHNLPIFWMTLVVFGFTYVLAAGIHGLVTVLAKGERARAFKAISPGNIDQAATQEWPMMARGTATLRFTPPSLAEALQLTLALAPNSEGQKTAQREIATALETAFDARRQRIIISQSHVNLVKWLCLFVQAAAALLAIAMIHCDNRIASAITVGLFATGVAASVLLIASHDRPFTGEISVAPAPLLQVMPDASR